MKKVILRAISLILVLVLCGSVPAFAVGPDEPAEELRCLGDVNGDGTSNAIDARWVLQVSAGARAVDETGKRFADMNEDGKINAVDARWILQTASGARAQIWYIFSDGEYARLPEYTLPDALTLVNTETARIAKNGGYTVQASCTYTKNVKLTSSIATRLLNQLIAAIVQTIDPSLSLDLDQIFGMLVGIDEQNYTVTPPTEGYTRAAERFDMIPMSLQESDVVAYRQEGTKLYFTLQNTTNPTKTGTSTLGRMTESFREPAEYNAIFSGVSEFVTVKKFDQSVTGVTLCVTVDSGKITAMEMQYDDAYSFDLVLDASSLSDATLSASAKIPVKGTAATRTAIQYGDILY